MVSVGVSGLVFRGRLWESEGAPVCVASDYAAGAEDLEAGITGDSGLVLVTFWFGFGLVDCR